MRALDITFASGPLTLAGSLISDEQREPTAAALLISGSGPIDRDSNSSKLSIDVMRQVAEHLRVEGIPSLRYDKRGVGLSDGEYLSAGFHDNVSDASAAFETLRSRPEIDQDQIFVIGHSEGALIATELAADNTDLAGVVLLAGTAVDGERVLRWQVEGVSATLPKPVKWLLRLLRQDISRTQSKRLARIKAGTEPVIRIQLIKINAKWLREFMAHDPGPSLQTIETPMLAATGSKDLQVDPGDVERICRLAPGECSGHVVENMTHLLRLEEGPPSLRTYKKQSKRPVDRGLLGIVTAWIKEHANQPAQG